MQRKLCTVFALLIIVVLSCSGAVKDDKDSYIIRYVNLSKVFDYAVKNDPEAAVFRNNIKHTGGKKRGAAEEEDAGVPETDYKENNISTESADERKIKSRIYGRIKIAVSGVARKHNADFILNTGDAVIFSKPAYDVTDDVIREYKKIHDISSPSIK